MAFSSARIQEAHSLLIELLGNRVSQIIGAVTADSDSEKDQFSIIKIPENVSTLSMEECLSLVARTSNRYAELANMAGVVSGMQKVAETRYKIKFKSSLKGKNIQERESNAVEAASDEMTELSIIEAVAEMLDTALIAARIASESARKILDKKQAEYQGQSRELVGYYMDKDFD